MVPSVDCHKYVKGWPAESLATTDTCTVKAVAVSEVDPVIDCRLAAIVAAPSVRVVARPAALTVATVVFDEVHVAELVRFCVLPSL
jgi:hypothetical protein